MLAFGFQVLAVNGPNAADTASKNRPSSRARGSSISCLNQRHRCPFDAPSAYIQGIQKEHEQTLARPPHDCPEWDERGVEIVWLLMHPLYG